MVRLGPKDSAEVLSVLVRRPLETVFLRGLILRNGIATGDRHSHFVGWRNEDGVLAGVALFSPLVVPFALASEDARRFGAELADSSIRVRNIVGRRETVQSLWAGMGADRPRPRLIRERQPVYWVDGSRLAELESAPIRRADSQDLDLVVRAGADMMREEVEEDPLADRPNDYRRYVRDRILRGDEYIWTDDDGLCFKCNISSRTPDVAQIEGVYTPPDRRRQGFAAAGLAALCRMLLHEVPTLCLYVNDFNLPAVRLYERLGFQREFDYQSIFFPPR